MCGMIHIYEGDGKGKTSAGVGLCIRCAGSGQKVVYTQFLKTDCSSELKILEETPNIRVVHCGECFGFSFRMTPEQKEQAKEFYSCHLKKVIELVNEEPIRLLVLDEIIDAYNLNMVDREELLAFIKQKPKELEVVMTGRDPDPVLVKEADYVSRIKKIKHPFDKGVPARLGIER